MNRLATVVVFSTALMLNAAKCTALGTNNTGMVYGFDEIQESADLTWTPCYDQLTCSRLQVPLDYTNPALGTTSIAFIKAAGKNANSSSPSIVIIPGGPGNSGVDLLLASHALTSQIFGGSYNFVSFDPRGVNNSGPHPSLDCFQDNPAARQTFARLHSTGVTNFSEHTSLTKQFYTSSIYGQW